MNHRVLLGAILAPLLFVLLPAAAQEKQAKTCRIVFLKAPAGAPKSLFLFDGKTSQEVKLPSYNLSQPYEFSAEAPALVLTPEAVADPEQIPAGAPRANVPANIGDCYLLVLSDPDNKVAPVEIKVIDAGRAGFRKGQMMWYNLSDKAVGGRVGTEKLAMKPGSRTVLNAPASGYDEYKVVLNFRRREDDKLHPLCETKWRHDPETRTLLFIVGEQGTRTPRIMGFPDDRRESEEEDEGEGE